MDKTREEEIRARAFALWDEAGRPEGQHAAHWYQAERDIDGPAGDGAVLDAEDDTAPLEEHDSAALLTTAPPEPGNIPPDSLPPAQADEPV